ncbi:MULTISPECIES: ABC transporter ATP-binding protein [unclassified Chelatococcus]|uniref:ABC transporter ATP-binding protein n=1 Tax=unclassified Chelatococcus TaxID=2638111 RepID=UPI001BCCE9E5|nr:MULTISPECIES: ABC transporter ATP-binding protein [unclassified Chelatococcus]CAH1647983.1 ABC transporter ATP-binding protein [Hyphomicrobiales bacterium]MBS7742110.1 ABC transporter ATP-binding protein [Chelatococcus sp. HY11]MBX3542772.1 ABC transporter ATP-binding protein [Chelatococcus sp.]MCO5075013.1 ABC transporter ATP-binding protein [Chelatococcus sp.]CAH1690142.1 ABC transporter ATP-binding protein [Hyphomicrobiales bacterium]
MSADFVLEAFSLRREFKGFVAVRDVNLKVRRGSVHALIGPNGAGKTTVFNLITKFLKPTSGRIVYDGTDITAEKPAQIARRGLVRSFQISATFPHLTVLQNVRVALQRKAGLATQLWLSERALTRLDGRARELIEAVNLQDYLHTEAAELSYGRKRALEFATTLALDPTVLLLDEPMAGMGHEDIDRIAELVQQAAVGRTILMVEHNLSVVSRLCDTISVLQRGEILAEGDYATVSADPRVREAYLGTEVA